MTNNESSSENIKCIVRCRPLNEKEKGLGTKCISISADSKVVIVENKDDKNGSSQYAMDKVFNEDITQEEIFKEVGEPLIRSFIGGYNCTIFCYGQTGAGKTHTMMGPLDQLYEDNSESQGLIPRIINYIFNEKQKVDNIITGGNAEKCKNISLKLKTCVMELYQEQIIDLLLQNDKNDKNKNNNNNNVPELKIKEDPKKGMYIQGITEMEVKTAKEAKDLILTGLKSRHVAATEMNAESSRSHLLFSIFVSTSYINPKGGEVKKSSRLHLIDLAGSERQKKTKAKGERIKEACMINKSLSTLGNVINALVENYDGKNKYIPFRDSKLTYFLKDSLGGNSKTTIVANISCSLIQISETISTLKFVQRAKMIKNKATQNVSVQENIEMLHEEIKKLKEIISKGGNASLLDENFVPKDFVCPICHNEPIEMNQEKLFTNFKSEITKLFESIIKNFTVEESIKKQFKNLDNEILSSGSQFFDLIEKYKDEYNKKLTELNDQIKLVNTFYESAKNDMIEANKKILLFKPGDAMNRIIFDKVNEVNNAATEIINKFNNCNAENFKKLETENSLLKIENAISGEMKKFVENQNKRKDIEKNDINKNSKEIKDNTEKFIKSNNDIIKFISENFLGKSKFNDELILLEKTKYNMLLFQIDEEKMTNRSLKRQIESLESEIYLTNIDIIRMNAQLEAYKANDRHSDREIEKKKTMKNDVIKEEKVEDESKKTSRSNSKESSKKSKNSNSDSENDEKKSSDDEAEIVPKKRGISTQRRGIIRSSNFDPNENAKLKTQNLSEKLALNMDKIEVVKMKERLDDMNEDLSNKISENEELKQEIYELKEKIEENNKNMEEMKNNEKELKEQIEGLDTTNEIYEKHISDLTNYKKDMNQELSEILNMSDLKTIQNEGLFAIVNEIFEKYKNKCNQLNDEIISKNNIILNLQKDINELVDNNINAINEVTNYCDENNSKINSLSEKYNSDFDLIKNFYDNVVKKGNLNISNKINDIQNDLTETTNTINNNENNANLLLNEMTELINNLIIKLEMKQESLNKLFNEKQSIINEKINSDEKNTNLISELNKDINSYKEKLVQKDSIIQSHVEQELSMNNTIDEIFKLLDINNENINKLNSIYSNDMSSFTKYYNNVILTTFKNIINKLNNNDTDINEVKELIKSSELVIDDLSIKYKQLNDNYFEKCCNLLKSISNLEIRNKLLNEKVNTNSVNETKYEEKIKFLENENQTLKDQNKNLSQSNELNISNINKLKKDIEKNSAITTDLNNSVLDYINQLKEKDSVIDNFKTEQNKINLKLKDLENNNVNITSTLDEKNNIINTLQNENNRQNKLIEEINKKNMALLQEIQNEKNNHQSLIEESHTNNSKINEMNEKMSKLFSEISEKNSIINKLNNEQSTLSQQMNEMLEFKNNYMSKINEKENEISTLQSSANELNTKLLDNNKQIDLLLNESQVKNNEISELNDIIQKNNQDLKNKEKQVSDLQKKIKVQENIISMNKNLRGGKPLIMKVKNSEESIKVNNDAIINLLKEQKENLLIEKLKNNDDLNKLNIKYNITQILSDLIFDLIKEFSDYQRKNNSADKNLIALVDTFIKDKKQSCKKEMKLIQDNLNKKLSDKNKINTDLHTEISEYLEIFEDTFKKFNTKLEEFLSKLNFENNASQINKSLSELTEDFNNLSFYNIPTEEGVENDILQMSQNFEQIIKFKLNLLNQIISNINNNIDDILTKEEIICEENICIYSYKNKNKSDEDSENFYEIYIEFKNKIKESQKKYKDIFIKIFSYRNELNNSIQLVQQNIDYFKQIANEGSSVQNNGQNTEGDALLNDEMKNALNNIQENRRILREILNKENSNIKNSKYNNLFSNCKSLIPNFNSVKNKIDNLINLNDISEKNINEQKLNFLMLKTLPEHYDSYKPFLSQKITENQNKLLINKIKIIMGDKFDTNLIYTQTNPELIWSQNEIPKIKSEILILREKKNEIENDLNALKLSMEMTLKGNGGNDSQLILLYRIKEENKKLKMELKQIKDTNVKLQEKIKNINNKAIMLQMKNSNDKSSNNMGNFSDKKKAGNNPPTNNFYDFSVFEKSTLSNLPSNKHENKNIKDKILINNNDDKDDSFFINSPGISNNPVSVKKKKKARCSSMGRV